MEKGRGITMLEKLKKEVCDANLELVAKGVVIYTWGNVSGIDREKGLIVIKPSGVDYERLEPKHMVILDLEGNVVEGDLNPSTDTPTMTFASASAGRFASFSASASV